MNNQYLGLAGIAGHLPEDTKRYNELLAKIGGDAMLMEFERYIDADGLWHIITQVEDRLEENANPFDKLRDLVKSTPHESIVFEPRFQPYYVNKEEHEEGNVVSVNINSMDDTLFIKLENGEIISEDDEHDYILTKEDALMVIKAIETQERGLAKETADAVKAYLVDLAAKDKLPLDMTQLDINGITNVILDKNKMD